MGEFYNFEWGKAGDDKARAAHKLLRDQDGTMDVSIQGVLIAAVVTARGRRSSPSSVLEELINSKRRTSPFIVEQLRGAWNIMAEQSEMTSDRFDVLTSLINPKHRNAKTGISETLGYQFSATHESFVDFWTTVTDMMMGFRSVSAKVFGVGNTVKLSDYLSAGMTRSQLLRAFGHELKDTDTPEDDGDGDDE